MRYLTAIKDLEGTNAQRRISEVIGAGQKAT